MCVETYNLYVDVDCQHQEYQHTFLCHIAKRSNPGDDNLLKETVFLPATRPNMPPGFLGCKVVRATRPVSGKCQPCRRAQSAAATAAKNAKASAVQK
ncbi:hypothetical protein GGS21DRAFT_500732 [Xylaria nigripes]|nr:hypothetical protein GGS21DRAFT_500732 [Xylaria nigripes]